MNVFVSASIALALVGMPAAVSAQVIQTYSYDGNGRLTGVTTTGSGGTNTAAYVYDDADNRTSRSQTGASTYAALSEFPVGGTLYANEALVSPDGRLTFAYRASGRLKLWRDDQVIWLPEPSADAPSFQLTETSTVRLIGPGSLEPTRAARLTSRNDGRLMLSSVTDRAVLWLSHTQAR